MRDRTRNYTSDLPRINLRFLADIGRGLVGAKPDTQLHCQTESGTLYIMRQADGYAMTINGVTRVVRTDTTRAGFGMRQWYICPHCAKRVAKLYIGSKDIACRECWKLHYKSQSSDRLDRMRMSIRRQRYAIWGDDERSSNLFNHPYTIPKPNSMRWETFNRKLAALVKRESAYWQAFRPVVDKITGRVS